MAKRLCPAGIGNSLLEEEGGTYDKERGLSFLTSTKQNDTIYSRHGMTADSLYSCVYRSRLD